MFDAIVFGCAGKNGHAEAACKFAQDGIFRCGGTPEGAFIRHMKAGGVGVIQETIPATEWSQWGGLKAGSALLSVKAFDLAEEALNSRMQSHRSLIKMPKCFDAEGRGLRELRDPWGLGCRV